MFKKIAILVSAMVFTSVQAENLATVNGVGINQEDVNRFIINARMSGISDMSQDEALVSLIRSEVVLQQAEKMKIADKSEVKQQIEELKKQIYIKGVMDEIGKNIKITDAEYKKAYEDMKMTMGDKQYKAQHILLKDEAQAKDMIGKLDKGEDFSKLARENSTGPTASVGGELGWLAAGRVVPEFRQALLELKKGEYSKIPVKTQFGYHVIKLNETKDIEPPKLDAVKMQLRNMLLPPKLILEVDKMVEKAKVVRN